MNRLARIAVLGALVVVLSSCRMPALSDIAAWSGRLPGPTYRIGAVFSDALNVPKEADVKLDGTVVGRVKDITTENYQATVHMDILETTTIPVGTRAEIHMASPLGDVFIALYPPKDSATPPALREGDVIGIGHTIRNFTPEDTLTALGNFVNGSGLQDLQVLIDESSDLMVTQVRQLRSMFERLDILVRTLNSGSTDLGSILDDVAVVTTHMAQTTDLIEVALDEGAPLAAGLAENTEQLTQLVTIARRLGDNAERMIRQSHRATITDLKTIAPVLDAVLKAEEDIAPLLANLNKLGKTADRMVPGDYLNLAGEIAPLQDFLVQELKHPQEILRFVPRPWPVPDLPGPLGELSDYLTDPLGCVLASFHSPGCEG